MHLKDSTELLLPVVVNGVVYIQAEENNYVYALNATDGTQLWDYFTGEWPSSPAVANGVVYVKHGIFH